MLKIKEVAKELGVSISWLDKYIKAGKIEVVWLGGVRRVSDEEVGRIRHEGIEKIKGS